MLSDAADQAGERTRTMSLNETVSAERVHIGFFGLRNAGKSSLVQLKYIKSLKMDINRRIKVTLENGEQLMVSRQYADELKKRLGVK